MKVSNNNSTPKKLYNQNSSKIFSIYRFLLLFQALLVFSSLVVGVYKLSPGIFSAELPEKVIKKRANGYDFFFQIRDKIPKKAVVMPNSLSTKSLSTYPSIVFDWYPYVVKSDYELRDYLMKIKDLKVSHVIFQLGESDLDECFGKKIYYGKSHTANRNPFNINIEYLFYVAELKSELLPECYNFSQQKE